MTLIAQPFCAIKLSLILFLCLAVWNITCYPGSWLHFEILKNIFHHLIVTVMGPFAVWCMYVCMYVYNNHFEFLKKFPGERWHSLDLIITMI